MIKKTSNETCQKLYDLYFMKAICDCFPKKENFKETDRVLRRATMDLNAEMCKRIKTECEAWVDRNVLDRMPETFLESRVVFKKWDVEKWQCSLLSVTDGIVTIEFVVCPPKKGSGMAVYHRVRRI